jgi:hypothetical protein
VGEEHVVHVRLEEMIPALWVQQLHVGLELGTLA